MLLTWLVLKLNKKPPGNYIKAYIRALSILPFINIV
jgi:hypothetical protein